ncbi:MAG: protein adenylyltransferase SelO [Steroidobacteraceae bacterium]
MRLGLEHSYAGLPQHFHAPVRPAVVLAPRLLAFNRPLAVELGLDPDTLEHAAAGMFSGNVLPEDAQPLAMAYAGHQFGNFVPQLGDGRAILLGELNGRDIQLKGAGRTPFSRGGDGRAAIGPMLREFIVSEAMHALGVPTTRSLAVVATGEQVVREEALPGAVLTRIAASHVRVGTFEYFAAREDHAALQQLLDYVLARHYPELRSAEVPALALLAAAADRQALLIAGWMLVGFVHGVMNTDNMTLSGETIDYGPCAFLDAYHANTRFSSIDQRGRYAYANQPVIAQWNLARLAESLLPFIHTDSDIAVAKALEVIEPFIARFDSYFIAGMRHKIGLASEEEQDGALIRRLLTAMQDTAADFTLTFRHLDTLNPGNAPIDEWLGEWRVRLTRDPQTDAQRAAAMRRVNPAFIPRNHRVEAALAAATAGDLAPFEKLCHVLQRPFDEQPDASAYAEPPAPSERVLQTFCGT